MSCSWACWSVTGPPEPAEAEEAVGDPRGANVEVLSREGCD
jgi:hypothetical protein